MFLLVQSADHITGLTGASPTVKLSKAGASGVSPSGAVSEIDSANMPGWYKVAGNATDTGTLGPLVLHATAASGDPSDTLYEVVAHDVQSATNLGLSALPTVAPGAAGGIFIAGSNAATTYASMTVTGNTLYTGTTTHTGAVTLTAGQTGNLTGNLTGSVGSVTGNVGGNVSGSIGSLAAQAKTDVENAGWDATLSGTSHNNANSAGKILRVINPVSDVIRSGTAQAGGASTITLDSGASAVDNAYQYDVVSLTGGTSAGQSRVILSYVGSTKVATVDTAWTTANPDATSTFELTPSAKAAVIGTVALSAAGLDNVVVETGVNARQALSPLGAMAAGVLAGAGTTTVTIAALNNPGTTRVTATCDLAGNRTAVTLNLPA